MCVQMWGKKKITQKPPKWPEGTVAFVRPMGHTQMAFLEGQQSSEDNNNGFAGGQITQRTESVRVLSTLLGPVYYLE